MNKDIINEIPEAIYNNPHLCKYVKYDSRGLITALYRRPAHEDDHKETSVTPSGEVVILPIYAGEWDRVSQNTIDAMNEEARDKGRITATPTASQTFKEKELEEAMALLQRLKESQGLE